ncbi:MAG: ATP-binding cassette domain-containing protein, partial [Bacteroidales bacterium]|nr:ATP-binding cassette domain-containing protein [Bacteroidales bacterium]
MNNTVVQCDHIRRTYENEVALAGICLEVGSEEIFGLIGPDGAGKTSLFRILATLILPDSGTASVLGFDVNHEFAAIRKSI